MEATPSCHISTKGCTRHKTSSWTFTGISCEERIIRAAVSYINKTCEDFLQNELWLWSKMKGLPLLFLLLAPGLVFADDFSEFVACMQYCAV